MKVMSFNTQHVTDFYGTGELAHQKYADYIKEVNPDVVGLNEIRSFWNGRLDFPNQTAILAELSDMPYCFFAKAIKKHPLRKCNSFKSMH